MEFPPLPVSVVEGVAWTPGCFTHKPNGKEVPCQFPRGTRRCPEQMSRAGFPTAEDEAPVVVATQGEEREIAAGPAAA